MSLGLSRRTFLGGLLAVAASTALGLRWWQGRRRPDFPVADLLELLNHRDSALLLGRLYRDAVPVENGKEPLIAVLAATFRTAGELPAGDQVSLRRLVNEYIRRDFTRDRVVAVDGWLLSVTEARLCALASLETSA